MAPRAAPKSPDMQTRLLDEYSTLTKEFADMLREIAKEDEEITEPLHFAANQLEIAVGNVRKTAEGQMRTMDPVVLGQQIDSSGMITFLRDARKLIPGLKKPVPIRRAD